MYKTLDPLPPVALRTNAAAEIARRSVKKQARVPDAGAVQRLIGGMDGKDPVQRKRVDAGYGDLIEAAAHVPKTAAEGTRGSGGALPHLDAIQRSFGRHDVSSVAAHTDAAAARASRAIGAEAYTTGDHVAFADAPSLHTAAHEAAHVVQQRAGVHVEGGVGKAGDVYEQHADAVADAVVQGRSTEALLDAHAGGGPSVQRKAVQRKDVPTNFGTFKTTTFTKVGTTGVDCVLEFHPDENKIDAKKIGLSQSIKMTYPDGSHTGIDPTKEGRRVKSGTGADYVLDRITTKNNPIYGAADLASGAGLDKTKADNNPTTDPTKVGSASAGGNASYQLGYAYTDGGAKKKKEAALYDRPQGGGGQMFETVALGLEGTDQGKYFGSVKWGFELKSSGTDIDVKDIELASNGPVPTQAYVGAAKLWNDTKTRGTMEVTANPAKAKKADQTTDVNVPKGTKGTMSGGPIMLGGKPTVQITTSGGDTYWIANVDLRDTQDGAETAKVPMVDTVFVNPTTMALYSDSKMTKKVKDLPANTRMQNTFCSVDGSYGMKVIDGPDLWQTGYVDPKLIEREK